MRSMTGYGRGIAERDDGTRITVDVRAVNHRFLDIKLRAQLAPAVEDALTSRLRAQLERGALVVGVHVERREAAAPAFHVDVATATVVHRRLADLASALRLPPPDLALVLAQPGVIATRAASPTDPEADVDPATHVAALDKALAQLHAMRTAEGAALAAELATRIEEIAAARASIASHAAALTSLLATRLHERIAKLAPDIALDPSRLAQEVALAADRADITEEIVRLASHLDQARALIAEPTAAVGRRLDFLVQEIGRELNTIGSKAQRSEISATIVDAKATLEKLREQVQNVE